MLTSQAPAGAIPFRVEPTSIVWPRRSQSALTLKKLHSDTYPSATSVLGFETFADKMPKDLKVTKEYSLSLGPQASAIWKSNEHLKYIKAAYVIELDDKKNRLIPAGIALVILIQHTLKVESAAAAE